MDGLREFLATSEPAGDTGATPTPETPVETLAAAPSEAPAEAPAADTAPATGEETEWRFDAAEFDQAHPELAPYRKQIQASFTRAQQELKEKYGAYEAVDPSDLQFIQHLYQVAAVNPQAAAQLLDQAKQQFLGPQYEPQPEPQVEMQEWEYATETERLLHQQSQQQSRELAEMRAWQQQQVEARNWQVINQQREAITQEFGAVPDAQWNQAARFCTQNRLPADQIGVAWKGLFGADAARRLGRSEASQVVSQKAAMTSPPSALNPPASTPPKRVEDAGSVREALEMSYTPG